MRASVFRELGGVCAEIAIFEDLGFSRRLGVPGGSLDMAARFTMASTPCSTSGWSVRTTLHDLLLTCGYLLHGIGRRPAPEAAPARDEPVVPRPSP